MKVGILSDTHDNLKAIRSAVGVFRDKGVRLILHAGDFVAPFTLPYYLESGSDFLGVFGNNDGDQVLLLQRSEGRIHSAPHVFGWGGRQFILTHYPDAVEAMARGKGADVVIYGHTHEPDIRTVDGCLIVNPGECGGWTTNRPSVAVLDLATLKAEIVQLAP